MAGSGHVCVRYADAQSFLARAQSWLVEDEAEHNLILSIAAQATSAPREDAYFVTIENNSKIAGCAFRTPPFKLGVTQMPAAAAAALATDVLAIFDDAPSVVGPEDVARAIAEQIAEARGGTARRGKLQRIYRLTRVIPPEHTVPGKLRLAHKSDLVLLTQWVNEFAAETDHGPGNGQTYTQANIANKTAFVWDNDGRPVTTSLWAGITPNGVRIGFVYTPPELRGRGYATACVAQASQRALDSGYKFCCLYTDLANRTSNSIYRKIGYEAVCDVVDYHIMRSASSGDRQNL